LQVETHLVAEDRQRAGAGAVVLLHAIGEDAFEQVVILVHGVRGRSLETANLPAGPAHRQARLGFTTDYTREMLLRPANDKGRNLRPALPIVNLSRSIRCGFEHRRPFGDLVFHERPQRLRGAVGGTRNDAAELEQALLYGLV